MRLQHPWEPPSDPLYGTKSRRAPSGIVIFARTYNLRMLVQLECNFRFEGEAGALQYDFRSEFVSHVVSITDCL
jgi:hypothetical protein